MKEHEINNNRLIVSLVTDLEQLLSITTLRQLHRLFRSTSISNAVKYTSIGHHGWRDFRCTPILNSLKYTSITVIGYKTSDSEHFH